MARPSHAHFMSRAVALALQGKGKTSPNPIVGAVIARQGRILAEGYHRKSGENHAEVAALRKLKNGDAKKSTLYVTMEPCCHEGKQTPPCVPQILNSGIRRVVVGARDPNPEVNGQGIRLLKKAGIEVIEGVLEEACADLNHPFQKWITTGLPYVTLKTAMSLDGKIATASGESKWISNTLSRRYVHHLRDEVDAVLVGAGTVKKDDPLLTARLPRSKSEPQPMVVVVDENLETPPHRRLFSVKNRKIVFATTQAASEERKKALMEDGAEIWIFDSDLTGRVDLKALLHKLGEKEVLHLLVEGGAGIFSSFMSQRLVDSVVLFLAPKLLGGQSLDWLSELNVRKLQDALELTHISVKTLGNDIMVEGELKT